MVRERVRKQESQCVRVSKREREICVWECEWKRERERENKWKSERERIRKQESEGFCECVWEVPKIERERGICARGPALCMWIGEWESGVLFFLRKND